VGVLFPSFGGVRGGFPSMGGARGGWHLIAL